MTTNFRPDSLAHWLNYPASALRQSKSGHPCLSAADCPDDDIELCRLLLLLNGKALHLTSIKRRDTSVSLAEIHEAIA